MNEENKRNSLERIELSMYNNVCNDDDDDVDDNNNNNKQNILSCRRRRDKSQYHRDRKKLPATRSRSLASLPPLG